MSNLFINNLTSNNASFTYLNIFNTQQNANIINGTFSNISTTNLTGTNATITALQATNEVATNITTTSLNVSNEVATNITTTSLNVSNEVATNITTTTLNVSNEVATNITTTSLNIVNVGKVVSTFGQWSIGGGASVNTYFATGTSISTVKTGLDFCTISNNTTTGLTITVNYSGFYVFKIGFQSATNDRLLAITRNNESTNSGLSAVGASRAIALVYRPTSIWQEMVIQGSAFLTAGDVVRFQWLFSSCSTAAGNNFIMVEYLCGIPSGY